MSAKNVSFLKTESPEQTRTLSNPLSPASELSSLRHVLSAQFLRIGVPKAASVKCGHCTASHPCMHCVSVKVCLDICWEATH